MRRELGSGDTSQGAAGRNDIFQAIGKFGARNAIDIFGQYTVCSYRRRVARDAGKIG
jgi:hypothetical protein